MEIKKPNGSATAASLQVGTAGTFTGGTGTSHSPESGFAIFRGAEMIITSVNELILQLWGRDAHIIGKPIGEIFLSEQDQHILQFSSAVYNSGKPSYTQREAVVSSDDEVVSRAYYEYVYAPISDAAGTITGVSVIAIDISERMRETSKASGSEKHFRALLTATSDIVYRMSADWLEMRELQGRGLLSDTSAPIRNWQQKYIHPQDQQLVLNAIKEAIANKSMFELEHAVVRRDGAPGWVLSRAMPILDDEGNILEWFGSASDITSRRQMESALAASKEASESRKRLYETITNNTPDLIYVFDLQYHFTYANEALLTMWGKTWEEAIGKGLLENGYEPWHAEMHEREIDTVALTKQPIRGEVSFPHAVLGRRIYDYIFVPVVNASGEVEAIAGTTRDITDIRNAERALQRSREELESQVKERTLALHRSNDDLQQFAHVASHDMREPVRKISTFVSRLMLENSQQLDEKGLGYLNKIVSAAKRMYTMIEGILSYSSLQSPDTTSVPVDVNDILHDIEQDLEIVIQQKKARITYSRLPLIESSPVLMTQLFSNLISNSLKFSREGVPPVIAISAIAVSDQQKQLEGLPVDRAYIKITLRDNGIGFNQEYAESIFQTFSRLNSKDRFEGTGLGLALCRKIVERYGGSIQASGRENEGAEFNIILPLQQP